ncbi:hypothetical protein [Enterocloster lavalensis]|uniref:hypothetical protein n=1 Tax=Enterocloster lavalensis TaxID=460384 RepID=UPI0026671D25|nr:hypothetical protein [Enterocloster lavalensis]
MAKREELLGPVVGPQGPKGDKGDCLFSLELDSNGNLYVIYQDGSAVPNLEFEAATGNLYLVVDE